MSAKLTYPAPMTVRSEILDGLKAGLPVMLVIAPLALLFGAAAVENGMTTGEAVWMSLALFAGASQMVGIELFGQQIAPWMIVLSIAAVNFRLVLYSAAMTRYVAGWSFARKLACLFLLTDVQFAEVERRASERGPISFAWYLAMGLPIYLSWVFETWIGAEFGRLIEEPEAIGIDFMITIYFFGMVLGLRKRPLWLPIVAASAFASVFAYRTIGSPWHVSIGALAGIGIALLPWPGSRPRSLDDPV